MLAKAPTIVVTIFIISITTITITTIIITTITIITISINIQFSWSESLAKQSHTRD